jgi:hypothetical protein
MDLTRFKALAAAYGGDLSRWPADERAAAETFRAQEPDAAALALQEELCLDATLDQWSVPAPSQRLRGKVLAGGPKAGMRAPLRWLWLTGAGLAAAGVSGAIFGAVLFSAVSTDMQADALLAAAAPEDGSGVAAWLGEGST